MLIRVTVLKVLVVIFSTTGLPEVATLKCVGFGWVGVARKGGHVLSSIPPGVPSEAFPRSFSIDMKREEGYEGEGHLQVIVIEGDLGHQEIETDVTRGIRLITRSIQANAGVIATMTAHDHAGCKRNEVLHPCS